MSRSIEDDPIDPKPWLDQVLLQEARASLAAAFVRLAPAFETLAETLNDGFKAARPTLEKLAQAIDDIDNAPRPDGRPHVPKPSRTPPMWANDPTKSRRRR